MRWSHLLTPREWVRLSAFAAVVALLHAAGWGLFACFAQGNPAFAGLGTLAYVLGLRHAFDPDHIAAIDNTTRKLVQDGRRPLGVGFFFAVGHAAIVCVLALTVAVAAAGLGPGESLWRSYGDVVSATVSGAFLLLVGILNVAVLRDTLRVLRELRRGGEAADLAARLAERSARGLVPAALRRRISASWQMLPLGVAFGLGVGTATEVALLAVTAGVGSSSPPFLAVLSLPLLFAAGMTLVDTADGALMTHAYGWAFANPLKKIYFNLTVTGLSVAAALYIGTANLLRIEALDTGELGYLLAGGLAVAWAASVVAAKASRS
jgi:high-affinity nickel-transport protein